MHQYCGGAATHEQLVPHLSSVAYLDRGRGRGTGRVRVRARLGWRALTLPQPLPLANLMAGWEEAEARRALGLNAAVEGAAVGVGVG